MPNNDLISRAALRETVEWHVTSVSVCATVEEARGRTAMKNVCLEDIDAAPAVDAVPVIHAQWVPEPDRTNHWHCSNCGFVEGIVSHFYNHCPICGAKMDGDENNAPD